MRILPANTLNEADRLVLQAISASPDGVLHGAKKLQKLLFMAHHPTDFGLAPKRPLRAFRFKVFKHGPFSAEVYGSLDRLAKQGLIEIETRDLSRVAAAPVSPDDADEDAPPMQVRVYRAKPDSSEELVGADETDRKLIRAAVEKWGWLTSEQIEELVLIRTGLTGPLKAKYTGVEWSKFEEMAGDERPVARPEPPEAFWKAQQAFYRERSRLLKELGQGKVVAYLGDKRVAVGNDEVEVYKQVVAEWGKAPDYMGFVSETGRRRVDAFAGA